MAVEREVVFMAFPFSSHPRKVLGLVRRLALAAPNVSFTFCNTAKSNTKLFGGAASEIPSNIKRFDVPDGLPSGCAFAGNLEEEIEMFLKVVPENFKTAVAAIQKSSGGKVGCIMGDAFMWFCADVAAEMGIPYVPIWTSGTAPLSLHLNADLNSQTFGQQGSSGAGRDDSDFPRGGVTGDLHPTFVLMLHNIRRTLRTATIMLINSVEELHPPSINHLKTIFPNVLTIGPLNVTSPPPSSNNLDDPYSCISWLHNQAEKSVAYLAFGTISSPPPDELKAIAEALEEAKVPFLWSIGDKFTSHLPQGFLERTRGFGKIVPWAPQVKVLEHPSIRVFITHSGWSSVLESITAGVPIICRPFFGDQPINSWMVEKVWRIGMKIDGGVFTKNGTTNAIQLAQSYHTQVQLYKNIVQTAVATNGTSTQNLNTLLKFIIGENH